MKGILAAPLVDLGIRVNQGGEETVLLDFAELACTMCSDKL
jgi:hypothetical protein